MSAIQAIVIRRIQLRRLRDVVYGIDRRDV
jgi:hypothetical protein